MYIVKQNKMCKLHLNCEHRQGASSAFLELPAELLIESHILGRQKKEGKQRHGDQISFHGADIYTITIHEVMMTIKPL